MLSAIVSVTYLFFLLFIAIGNLILIYSNKDHVARIPKKYGFLDLYKEFKEKQSSFIFPSVFLIRRLLISLVIVMIGYNQSIQIFVEILLSLLMLIYLILYQPFEEAISNKIQLVNEFAILFTCYHLIIFSDSYDNARIKYKFGWSFNLIILLVFIVNTFIIFIPCIRFSLNEIRRFCKYLRVILC